MKNDGRPVIAWFIPAATGRDMPGHSGGPPLPPNIARIARGGVTRRPFHTASPMPVYGAAAQVRGEPTAACRPTRTNRCSTGHTVGSVRAGTVRRD